MCYNFDIDGSGGGLRVERLLDEFELLSIVECGIGYVFLSWLLIWSW